MSASIQTEIEAWLQETQRHVERVGQRRIARIRRRFEASLQRVWIACTDREQLRRWFADASGELREGTSLTLDVGAPFKITSRILQCEPHHKLLLTWSYPGRDVDEIECVLAAEGDCAFMRLEHRSIDVSDWWLGAGSGWEFALIRLGVLLKGGDPGSISAEDLDPKLGPLWIAAGQAGA